MKNVKRIAAALVIVCLAAAFAHAGPSDMKSLTQGKDSFSVKEPKNWDVNVDDAKARGMYAYFTLHGTTYKTSPALIYIRLLDKMGLSVAEHLKGDMDNSRKQEKALTFGAFDPGKLQYAYAAKKYIYGTKSCDYVVYLDPGKDEASYLVFVLSADKKHCDSYRDDFRKMIESFLWGPPKE